MITVLKDKLAPKEISRPRATISGVIAIARMPAITILLSMVLIFA
jgi:hypothetical protein